MTEQDKIYAASVLDQGSFFSIQNNRPYIRMRRMKLEILKPIHEVFGGSLGVSKDGLFWLNFVGYKCTYFLISVLPYLKVKFDHARVILKFNDHVKERARGAMTEKEKQYRQGLAAELKEMNAKDSRPESFDLEL